MTFGTTAAREAADTVRELLGDAVPNAAIILGSGLGGLCDEIESVARFSYRDIPGFPDATVAGHSGTLIAGRLEGKFVVALAGRFHIYEGHDVQLAAFP